MDEQILRFIRYLSFKQDCLRHQEANPLTIDLDKAQKHYDELDAIVQEKTEALAKVMPNQPDKMQNKPKVLYKKDGSYSAHGKKWFDTLRELKLPPDTEGPVVVEWKDGNPGSTQQVKDWLLSLGWKPCTFKFTRNKLTGEEKQIPQVRYVSPSDPRKGQLTDSVLRLKDRVPEVEILEGLTVAQHRKAIFEGFLKDYTIDTWNNYPNEGDSLEVKTGKIVSSAGGFTNTLRLKHRAPIVNLPGVEAAWGKEIRGCLVAPESGCKDCQGQGSVSLEGYPYRIDCKVCEGRGTVREVMIGSDVSSLEDMTRRHYIKPLDPALVAEQDEPGYDAHLAIAVDAGVVTQDEYEFYKWYKAGQ